MEDIDRSPLSAFPNEHPTPGPSPLPFYKKRTIIFGVLGILFLAVSFYAGTMFLAKNQRVAKISQTQQSVQKPTVSPPLTANWNTYETDTYSYQVKYAQNTSYIEKNTKEYGFTQFKNGCFSVYAVPQKVVPILQPEPTGIPWKQIEDLKNLPVGQTKNCALLTFTFNEKNQAVIQKNDYKKLDLKKIGGDAWYAFAVTNSSSQKDNRSVYFMERNNYLYVIDMKQGASCGEKETAEMLTTFSLTR